MFNGKNEPTRDLYIGFGKVKPTSVKIEENNEKKFLVFNLAEATGKFTSKISFLISLEERTSKDGIKFQWIDTKGRTKWGATVPESSIYFEANGARKAYLSEEEVTSFIAALANVEKDGEARFNDFKAIIKGNLSEIEDTLKAYPNNKVGVALGIRNGKYQTIYSRKFVRGWAKDGGYLKKEIEKDTYNKDFYGTNFDTMVLFDPSSITPNDGLPSDETTLPQGDTLAGTFGDTSHIEIENPVDYDSLPF